MARTIGNAGTCCFGIVVVAITIVSHPEFPLFKVWCLIAFGEAITSGKHEMFKLASKHLAFGK